MTLKLLIYFPKQVLAIYTYTRPCNVDDGEIAPSGKEFCTLVFCLYIGSFSLVSELSIKCPKLKENIAGPKSFFTPPLFKKKLQKPSNSVQI